MDDKELAALEQRLRRAAAGHKPQAPDSLLRFIDSVPAQAKTSHTMGLMRVGWRAPRSVLAVATAAAVVFAVVAGIALVAVRNGLVDQSAPGAAWRSDGWSWQRADGTLVNGAIQVPNGYVGSCGSPREPALCTSPDGLQWTTPADPRIFIAEGDSQYLTSIAQWDGVFVATGPIGGTYVASTATPTPILTASDGTAANSGPTTPIWRSTDGVHWSRVDSPAFSGLTVTYMVALGSGFVAITSSTPDETGWALTSTDGLTWVRASKLPVQPGISAAGAAGLFITSTTTQADVWRTLDGKTWTRAHLPDGIGLGQSYKVPGGGYVALGMSAAAAEFQILRSADGLTWQVDQGDLVGAPLGFVAVGDRFVADVSPVPLNSTSYPDASAFASIAFQVWQSVDWGRTWQPLLDSSGHQLSGRVWSLGDRLAISVRDDSTLASRITWVGTPSEMAPPAQSTQPSTESISTPSPRQTGTPAPSQTVPASMPTSAPVLAPTAT
jgi:hypothetical protein